MKIAIHCDKCHKPMEQGPYGMLAWYCGKCRRKASISYSNTPIVGIPSIKNKDARWKEDVS